MSKQERMACGSRRCLIVVPESVMFGAKQMRYRDFYLICSAPTYLLVRSRAGRSQVCSAFLAAKFPSQQMRHSRNHAPSLSLKPSSQVKRSWQVAQFSTKLRIVSFSSLAHGSESPSEIKLKPLLINTDHIRNLRLCWWCK